MTNLNDRVTVKLTPSGFVIWEDYWHKHRVIAPQLKDGTWTAAIWEVMHVLFGAHAYNGSTTPIEMDVTLGGNPPDIITPAMTEAGAKVLCRFETLTRDEASWAEEVYLSMWKAAR